MRRAEADARAVRWIFAAALSVEVVSLSVSLRARVSGVTSISGLMLRSLVNAPVASLSRSRTAALTALIADVNCRAPDWAAPASIFKRNSCVSAIFITCLLLDCPACAVEKWRTGTGNRPAKVMRDLGEDARATAALQRSDCAPILPQER
ncbi:MAG: hypothetical protein CML69_04825 [Rhodobacteraceae bacterium]|nr:hypothetical protein [Paracoccaceae bacterium]